MKDQMPRQEIFSIFGNNEMLDARKYDCPIETFVISSETRLTTTTKTVLNENNLDIGETVFSKALPGISTVRC